MTFPHPSIILARAVRREYRADPPLYAGPSIMVWRCAWFCPESSIVGSSAAATAELGTGYDADDREEYQRLYRARKKAEAA